MRYVVDFDGTIVDVWNRFFLTFCLASQIEKIGFDAAKYRSYRLSGISDYELLLRLGSPVTPNQFRVRKRRYLESQSLLSVDTLLVEQNSLLAWFAEHNAHIVTMRRSQEKLENEMRSLGISDLLSHTVVINPDGGYSKRDWVQREIPGDEPVCAIGDAVTDMEIGTLKNAIALHVSTGLCSWDEISEKCPWSKQIESLNELLSIGG